MERAYDAVVVGAGHNGLVAAVLLARAGWSTLVLEQAERPGGAVKSGEVTRPGFVHDLYSMNHNLFLASPFYTAHQKDLQRHGLTYAVSDRPYANAFPDGTSLRVYQDPARTVEGLRAHDSLDAEGWEGLSELFDRFAPALFSLYAAPVPSWSAAAGLGTAARRLRRSGLEEMIRLLLSSTRELGDAWFSSREAKAMLACWGMHLDLGPDVSGGAMFPFLETFADQQAGMSVVRGGASKMVGALVGMLEEAGGQLRTDAEVEAIEVDGSGASGVRLTSGERIVAHRAVVANVTPTALYERLLGPAGVPERVRRDARRFRYGPGTMMIHLALDGPVPWAAGDGLDRFAYVHVAPYVEQLAETYTAAVNGLLPADPLLVVGQTSAVDSSRAPDGQHVLWVQVRALPAGIRGDAMGEIEAREWDSVGEPYASRVMQKLETYAPGLGDRVLDRVVLTPADLERDNPNLVGGDSLAGSMHLDQNFFLRPLPGFSRYGTAVPKLMHCGASTWPGGGVNALSGWHVGKQLTENRRTRVRRRLGR